jgi:hypothetical protein
MLLDLIYFSVSPGIVGQTTRRLEKASGLRESLSGRLSPGSRYLGRLLSPNLFRRTFPE